MEMVYKRLNIECESRTANSQDPANPLPEARCHYWSDGSRERVDREYSATAGRVANQTSSFVKAEAQSFIVDRKPGGSSYALRGLGTKFQGTLRLDGLCPPAVAAFSVGEDRIVDLLAKRGFAVEDAVVETTSDQESVVVRWNWPWEGTGPAIRRGEFRLLPSRDWALVSYHWRQRMPDKTWRDWESYSDVSYGNDFEGVPLVETIEQGAKMDDTSKVNTTYWRVTSVGPSTPSARDFTLAAFNLKYEQGKLTRNYGWVLVAIGAVGLLASLAIRGWISRRRSGANVSA